MFQPSVLGNQAEPFLTLDFWLGLSLGWVALLPPFQSHLKILIYLPPPPHTPSTPPQILSGSGYSLISAAQDLETTVRGITFFFLSFNELLFTYNKNERSWIFHWWVLTWCSPKPRYRNSCYSPKAPLCPFVVNPHCFSEATTLWLLLP